MTIMEAIDARHSVRAYRDQPIPEEVRRELNAMIESCNREGHLHISARYDDPEGFDSRLAHYGRFQNVKNYIVLAGEKREDFDFRCGYYGEKIVLYAQQLGLNTCWVALTFNRKMVKKILRDGAPAVADYRRFLSAGCSVPPIEALKLAGIDMSSPEPVRRAMEVFRETVEKMKAVAETL